MESVGHTFDFEKFGRFLFHSIIHCQVGKYVILIRSVLHVEVYSLGHVLHYSWVGGGHTFMSSCVEGVAVSVCINLPIVFILSWACNFAEN